MLDEDRNLHALSHHLVWSGFKQLIPLSFFVMTFGAAFGLAATQLNLDDSVVVVISALMFAGYAQFAALGLWGAEIPILTLALTVFAINARHLLMGASLYPWLSHLSPVRRYGIMLVATDANWAMSMNAFNQKKSGLGLLLGGGIALWLSWVLGTWLGVYSGSAIENPMSLGLDMAMGCFLVAMIVEGEKSLRLFIIWVVAALSSLTAYWYLPENSHVIVGALAGGLLSALWPENNNEY